MEKQNELVQIINETGLEQSKAQILMQSFSDFHKQAHELALQSDITVTDETQTDLMAKARSLRLKLRDLRTKGIEPTRIKLKESLVRESKAIDGMANILKALIVPIEERLQAQEDFAENLAKHKLELRYFERKERLNRFVDDVTMAAYDLNNMSDEVFENILASSKLAFETKVAAEKKAEEDRLAKIEADKVEAERIRKENEVLKKQAEEREAKILADKKIQEEKDAKVEADRQKELAKLKDIQDKRIEAEKKQKEEAEAKIKEMEAQKQKEVDAENARVKLEEENKRKALLAPDKEKLINLAGLVASVQMPNVESASAGKIVDEVELRLLDITNWITNEAKKL